MEHGCEKKMRTKGVAAALCSGKMNSAVTAIAIAELACGVMACSVRRRSFSSSFFSHFLLAQ